jgi:hypothetical protein
MKKVISVFCMAVAMIATLMSFVQAKPVVGNCESSQDHNFVNDAIPITITINLELGRKSRDCGGFGICKASIDIELDLVGGMSDDGGNVVLTFDKANYERQMNNQFKGNQFTLEEDFAFDANIARALGQSSITAKKGTYPVTKTASGYEIRLRK